MNDKPRAWCGVCGSEVIRNSGISEKYFCVKCKSYVRVVSFENIENYTPSLRWRSTDEKPVIERELLFSSGSSHYIGWLKDSDTLQVKAGDTYPVSVISKWCYLSEVLEVI